MNSLYIDIFVEPSSFVRKLLLQHVCDGRETRPYYRAPHGECHKGVGGRQFVTAEKSAAQAPTLTEIDACEIPDTLLCVKKAVQCPRGDARTPGTQRHVGGPLCTNKLQKIACAVVCPSQIARQLASATYSMLLLLYSFMKEVTPSAKAGINGEP